MIRDIIELNFPKKDGKQYATLTHATANIADMGEKTITTQVKIDGEIVPNFSQDWEVEFQGEKYIMPLRIPQGAKENTSLNSTIDLTFQHWAIYQLKRWPFVTIQQIAAGTYMPDEEEATVQLNLKDFCILFGQVLEYYYGDAITIDLNPAWQYDNAATLITISHTKIWNVLIDTFHDKYGVRWEIKPATDNSNTVKGGERYVIRVGYPTTEVDHIFEYGFDGGLLKVERQVQSEEIRNMLKGRGGETNIPFRYFKDTDPNNKDFRPDPDWVEELANIYFPNLMPATFRSYIQGWKAAHISKYPGYTAVGESNAYAPWAYRKGYTDTKFSPVEFVADEITINPTTGDKQVEILPGYSPYVKNGSSLDKYGPLPDTLDNNEDIYPTLQGTGLDIAVDVEQIESDDVAESTESDAQIEDKTYPDIIKRNIAQGHTTVADASKRTYFTVPTGKKANIEGYAGAKAYNPKNHEDKSNLIAELGYTIKVFNAVTGAQHSASGIPAGDWYFTVEYSFNNTSPDALNVTLSFNSVKITSATPDDKWRNTFDIWVKNIWDSVRLAGETDSLYAERVWKPVLGDREGNEAKVVFTSGALAISEDYEFTIVDTPVPDTSKTWQEKNDSGVVIATHTSHWRIKLAKSEAELEATGLYVPSTKKQGKAGDRFVFIGTEMTHVPYVVDAEERLDDWKKDQLGEVKEIKPTFVVTTDRVRLNNEGRPDALINQLRVGNSIRLADKRFIAPLDNRAYETLYLQSITYTYRESSNDDAALNPDVEIVLGSEYATSANPVSMMQGEISALQRQVGAISNIEQIVRAVGDRLYLRKDGIPDRSLSPTQFFSLLTSGDFRAGMIGGAGWGFYKDENGNTVLEADRVNVRQDMLVNTLVINQAEGRGGMEIDTAAYMTVTRVVETDEGYVCYFDQKGGSVANLFHIDDVAYCQRFTPENAELKFYKRRVVAVGVDSITLTKALTEDLRPADWPDSGVNGAGIPAEGDNIIHFGNYTDATRQYVKVRDVINGGYERYLDGLNSVNAQGDEYYFVGRQVGMYGDKPRWFIGERKTVENEDGTTYEVGEYAEYIDGKLNIKGSISIQSTVGDKTLGDLIDVYDASEYLRKALPQDTDITGGVILSTLLSLGYKDDAGLRHTMAGMNGSWVNALNGRTIASWWGGSMLDLFKEDDTRKTLAELIEESGRDDPIAAASLVRMDGSAYFAKGNIGFRADGSGWLGNDLTGIKFSNSGAMTFGNGVKINLSDGSEEGIASTLESLLNFNTGLSNLLAPCDSAGSEIPWSEATQSDGAGGIKAKSLKAKLGLWSPAFLTAHGQTSNISGGGGESYDRLDSWADYSTDKAGYVLSAGLGWDLNMRVKSLETGSALTIVETGGGNAVTSISKSGTVVTATKGATFLTSHQPLDAYMKFILNDGYVTARFNADVLARKAASTYIEFWQSGAGWFNLKAGKYMIPNGTSSQFLKADGSTDDTHYVRTLYGGESNVKVDLNDWCDSRTVIGSADVSANAPGGTGWYNVIQLAHRNGVNDGVNYVGQIALGMTANVGEMYFRSLRTGAWRRVLTSDNYASVLNAYYVKKTGDTMTGALAIKFNTTTLALLNSTGTVESGMGFRMSDVNKGWVGYNVANGAILYNYASDKSMGIKDDGTPHFMNNTLWHAGNDGAGSGLDADMLDGYHSSWFYQETLIDASALDEDTWYPITIKLSAMYRYHFEIVVSLNSGTTPSWSGHSKGFSVSVVWDTNGNDWGGLSISRRILSAVYNWATTWPVGGITQLGNSSNEVIYVRGGGKYFLRSNRGVTPILRTTTYTASDQSVSPTTTQPAAPNVGEGIVAQRLNSWRTIWGQSFNGTSNVSGKMTGVGEIEPLTDNTYDCGTQSKHWNAVRTRQLVSSYAGILWIWHNSAQPIGFATSARERMRIDSSGNVGIGTSSPAYKLDVEGAIHSSVGVSSDGYVTARGQNSASDIRLKNYMADVTFSVDQIADAPLWRFSWRRDGSIDVGSIAQYWRAVMPELTHVLPDAYLGLDYGKAALLASVSLAREHRDLAARVACLERENKQLKKLLKSA